MANIRTHYDNLKVARNAPVSVIKAAYKALCQTYHPDKFQGSNKEAERIMKIVNASYEVLIDPVKRAIHDAWIQEQQTCRPDINPTVSATSSTYDFVVYPSKKKIAWMFIVSTIFVAIGIGLFLENKSEISWIHETMRVVAIYFGVPFFGWCGFYLLSRLINPSPSIIINEHGIQVMTFSGATLRWSDIADIRIEEYQKNRFLALCLTNPEIVMKRQSLWGRLGTKFNAFFMDRPPAIVIAESLVGMPLEQLIGEMTSRMPNFGKTGEATEQQYYQRQDKHDIPKTEEPLPPTNSNKSKLLMVGGVAALLISIFAANIIMLVIGLGLLVAGVFLAITNSGKNKNTSAANKQQRQTELDEKRHQSKQSSDSFWRWLYIVVIILMLWGTLVPHDESAPPVNAVLPEPR